MYCVLLFYFTESRDENNFQHHDNNSNDENTLQQSFKQQQQQQSLINKFLCISKFRALFQKNFNLFPLNHLTNVFLWVFFSLNEKKYEILKVILAFVKF